MSFLISWINSSFLIKSINVFKKIIYWPPHFWSSVYIYLMSLQNIKFILYQIFMYFIFLDL